MTSRRVFLGWAGLLGAGLVALVTRRQPPVPPAADVYLDVYPRGA